MSSFAVVRHSLAFLSPWLFPCFLLSIRLFFPCFLPCIGLIISADAQNRPQKELRTRAIEYTYCSFQYASKKGQKIVHMWYGTILRRHVATANSNDEQLATMTVRLTLLYATVVCRAKTFDEHGRKGISFPLRSCLSVCLLLFQ